MVDIHCHIIPEVDDGAWDMDTAVEMARVAADSGVTKIVATPHFEGRPEALESLPYIQHQFRKLQSALKGAKVAVELIPGVEILCLPQTLELARRGQLPTLGRSRYVLVEFFFDASAGFMEAALQELKHLGYRPVVAHPERYGAVQRDLDLAAHWFRHGFALQLNKGSVLGAFGQRAEETATRLLYRGHAHIIASDAHSPEVRTPNFTPVREWCLENLGQGYTKILLEDNPGRIVRGRELCQARGGNTSL